MTDSLPPVLIVGAGDTGLALATVLTGAGLGVSTLNRSGRSIDAATALVGDLADSASLMGLPSADVVVFTTAPPSRDDEGYRTAYLDGPQRLLDALPTEPARAVLTSTTGVYGADDGRWVTATTPPDPSRSTAAIVVEGEAALARRIPTTVVRSAGIYGPGRRRLIDQVLTGVVGVTPGCPPAGRIACIVTISPLRLRCASSIRARRRLPSPSTTSRRRDDVLAWIAAQVRVDLGPDPSPIVAPTGKRCRNSELKDLGWELSYPTFREGYTSVLATL